MQGARTALDGIDAKDMTLAIGFGGDATAATAAATGSLASGFAAAQTAYDSGWSSYLASLKAPPAPVAGSAQTKRLYEQSLLVLAGLEDKANRGASIAAPNMPWIWGTLSLSDDKETSDPYHLVWPRDFYHAATAQKAAGDDAAADPARGLPVGGPEGGRLVLAEHPRRRDPRLEEPAARRDLAAGRARLVAGPHRRLGLGQHPRRGRLRDGERPAYEALADDWQSKVDKWTATNNGPYAPRPHYLRVTKDAKPNSGTMYTLGDNFPRQVDQREIVDNSFLGLVLFGVKRWDDRTVLNSLKVGDETSAEPLLVNTKNGQFWRRFTFDGYGEQADGGDWDLFFDNPARQTFGRAWPLLAGERGEYELIAGKDATTRLKAIAGAANDGMMLPEQVWDGRPPNESSGEGTRSATPLAWTHAQFVRLAWSIQAGKPIERPSIVACRYQKELCG